MGGNLGRVGREVIGRGGDEEIEITDDMVEAGRRAWSLLDAEDYLDVKLCEIYEAMERSRRSIGQDQK